VSSALEGDLKHFFPTEVLQLLQLAQADGRLELSRPGESADLYFERGRPVFARTDGAAVRAGEVLVHRGQVAREALERALELQRRHPGERLGALLVSAGIATPEQVQQAVHETLRRFRFHPGESVAGEDIQLDLDLDRLILEGLRFADQSRSA